MTDTNVAPEPADDEKTPTSRRRWKYVLALVVITFCAPSAVTMTGQQHRILAVIHPKLAQVCTFRTADLHWWKPVRISNLTLREFDAVEHAPALLEVETITTRQSLWDLLIRGGANIELDVLRPVAHIRVQDGTTNLQQTLEHIQGSSQGSSNSILSLMTLRDGTIHLSSDAGSADSAGTVFDKINASLSLNNASALPSLELAAVIRQETQGATHSVAKMDIDPRIASAIDLPGRATVPMDINSDHDREPSPDAENRKISVGIGKLDTELGGRHCTFELQDLDAQQLDPLLNWLRPGLSVSGRLSCAGEGLLSESEGFGFAGKLQAAGSDLVIRDNMLVDGERIQLDRLTSQIVVVVADDGLLVRDLTVSSDILSLTGSGEIRLPAANPIDRLTNEAVTQDQQNSAQAEARALSAGNVRIQGRLDVPAFASMLPQTLRLNKNTEIREGQITARLELHQATAQSAIRADAGQYRWDLRLDTSPFVAFQEGRQIRVDSAMSVDISGTASPDGIIPDGLEVKGRPGKLSMTSAADGIRVDGTLHPELLWQELSRISDFPRPGISRPLTISGVVLPRRQGYQIESLRVDSEELQVNCPGLWITSSESSGPSIDGRLSLHTTGAVLKTVAAPWHDLAWLADRTLVDATVDASSEIIIVSTTVRPQVEGSFSAAHSSELQIDRAHLRARLESDSATGVTHVSDGLIRLPGLTVAVSGNVDHRNEFSLNLSGELEYDLQTMSRWIMQEDSADWQLQGSFREPFTITGAPSALSGRRTTQSIEPLAFDGAVGWQGGTIAGLPLGPGRVAVRLRDGLVTTEPFRCSLGTGEVTAMPQWDLEQNLVRLAPGSRISKLELNTEESRRWISWITPLMANATNVTGAATVRVQTAEIPLSEPEQSHITGTVQIHHAEATAGSELAALVELIRVVSRQQVADRRLLLPEQQVSVDLRRRTLTHDRLQMEVAGYPVASSGSVTLDGIVRMILEVPLSRSVSPGSMRTVQVPVGGSVSSPQIDLRDILARFGQGQIENRVRDELNRGLERLLDKL